MNWERITVNVEPALEVKIKARAKKLRQSVSGYVVSLIDRDLEARTTPVMVEEEQTPYEAGPTPKKPKKDAA